MKERDGDRFLFGVKTRNFQDQTRWSFIGTKKRDRNRFIKTSISFFLGMKERDRFIPKKKEIETNFCFE